MDWDEAQYFPVGDEASWFIWFSRNACSRRLWRIGTWIPRICCNGARDFQIDPSIGLSIAAHNSLCTNHILKFGSESQKSRWLPKLASGEWIGAWGLTEHNTGSDAGGMNSTAVKDGDHWVLNGTKNFITHGISADVSVVILELEER